MCAYVLRLKNDPGNFNRGNVNGGCNMQLWGSNGWRLFCGWKRAPQEMNTMDVNDDYNQSHDGNRDKHGYRNSYYKQLWTGTAMTLMMTTTAALMTTTAAQPREKCQRQCQHRNNNNPYTTPQQQC